MDINEIKKNVKSDRKNLFLEIEKMLKKEKLKFLKIKGKIKKKLIKDFPKIKKKIYIFYEEIEILLSDNKLLKIELEYAITIKNNEIKETGTFITGISLT